MFHIRDIFQRSALADPQSVGKQKIRIGSFSQPILDEYQRVSEELSSKFPSIDISQVIDVVTIHGLFVYTRGVSIAVCDDPDDDKFIECAAAGNCEFIISGDKHLINLSEYRGIAILTPRDFVDRNL